MFTDKKIRMNENFMENISINQIKSTKAMSQLKFV